MLHFQISQYQRIQYNRHRAKSHRRVRNYQREKQAENRIQRVRRDWHADEDINEGEK